MSGRTTVSAIQVLYLQKGGSSHREIWMMTWRTGRPLGGTKALSMGTPFFTHTEFSLGIVVAAPRRVPLTSPPRNGGTCYCTPAMDDCDDALRKKLDCVKRRLSMQPIKVFHLNTPVIRHRQSDLTAVRSGTTLITCQSYEGVTV